MYIRIYSSEFGCRAKGVLFHFGNGHCNSILNVAECHYDGGDCCLHQPITTTDSNAGIAGTLACDENIPDEEMTVLSAMPHPIKAPIRSMGHFHENDIGNIGMGYPSKIEPFVRCEFKNSASPSFSIIHMYIFSYLSLPYFAHLSFTKTRTPFI